MLVIIGTSAWLIPETKSEAIGFQIILTSDKEKAITTFKLKECAMAKNPGQVAGGLETEWYRLGDIAVQVAIGSDTSQYGSQLVQTGRSPA